MTGSFKQFKIFVSSPGDVAKERKVVDDVINKINEAIGDSLGIFLKVEKWEKLPPETTEERIQERLNRQIKDCNFFLLILFKRYGSIEKGHTISNTEREINAILTYLAKDKKKKILSYFKELKNNEDVGPQEQAILDLKNRLRESGSWFSKDFTTERDFESKLTHDLYQILLRMGMSSFKIEQLKRFWQVGRMDSQPTPKVYVVYPPVPREWMSMGGIDININIWQKRLLPNIFYEDYKALHKILKNLSMVGLSDYKVYSKYDTPPDFDKSNIVWICLPRQTKGLSALSQHDTRRFNITPRKKNKESVIEWEVSEGKWITIKSPLKYYLKRQRENVDPQGDWDRTLGNIIAKDYAIIARFDRTIAINDNPGMDKLKEFYLTGIHGLGTWGAAWFVDRSYGFFLNMDMDEDDFQILVEVEYRDGRIYNVKDVSDCDLDYFEKALNPGTIKRVIEEYKDNMK